MTQGSPLPVLPAVDVLDGEAVRLLRGNYRAVAVRAGDPFALVRRWAAYQPPLVHVVDLDGARSGRVRPELVAAAVEAADGVPVQFGGGVRTPEDAHAVLEAGAARVIVGTAALPDPAPYVDAAGACLVVALDVAGDRVAAAGWLEDSGLALAEALARCAEAGVARILCTAIDRDGTLTGPNEELLRRVLARSPAPVLAAGGVRGAADLDLLAELGVEAAVVGRALHDGTLSPDAVRERRLTDRARVVTLRRST